MRTALFVWRLFIQVRSAHQARFLAAITRPVGLTLPPMPGLATRDGNVPASSELFCGRARRALRAQRG